MGKDEAEKAEERKCSNTLGRHWFLKGWRRPERAKLGPRWAQVGLRGARGSELKVIFGHVTTKMAVKFDLRAILEPRRPQGSRKDPKMGPRWAQDGPQGGPRWAQDEAKPASRSRRWGKIKRRRPKSENAQKPDGKPRFLKGWRRPERAKLDPRWAQVGVR